MKPPSDRLSISLLFVLLALVPACALKLESKPKYVANADGYLMLLREGDDAFAQLSQLAAHEKLAGASFSGFGFGHATFAYFDQHKKKYERHVFRDVELASLSGSIAWKDGSPELHAHGVAADRSFTAHGGHLLAFKVGKGALELQVIKRLPAELPT